MRIAVLIALPATLILAAPMSGQTKFSGELKCNKADPVYSIEVGDRPGHFFRIAKAQCSWTRPFEIEGLRSVGEEATYFVELSGDRSRAQGRNVGTMSNGDKYNVRTQSAGTFKDGVLESAEVKWTWTGTGKLKGVTAKGVSHGKGLLDGTAVWTVEGEYQIKR